LSYYYSFPTPYSNNPIEVEETELYAKWFSQYINPGEESNEPIFDIVYPIIDTFGKPLTITTTEIDSKSENMTIQAQYAARGAIQSCVYWRDVIRDILPPGRNGLVIVVENPCAATFTYQLR
jgi:hypothetical protein